MTREQAIEAIHKAQLWTTCDWDTPADDERSYLRRQLREGGRITDDDGEELTRAQAQERLAKCDAQHAAYVAEVERDASKASELADRAIVAIESGDLELALAYLDDAAKIERSYGDDPSYHPAVEAVRALTSAGEED